MNLNKKKTISSLQKHSKQLLFIFLFALPISFYAQESLFFNKLSEQEVINKLSEKLDIKFNYNHAILKDTQHSFSVSGSKEEILAIVEKKLKIKCQVLEEGIYAINTDGSHSSIDPPYFIFFVKDEQGNTLPYCNVIVNRFNVFFQTDEDGKVKVEGYFSEKELVQISFVGFETRNIKIENLKEKQSITLRTSSHVLGEVVITEFLRSLQSNDINNKDQLQDIDVAGISDQDLLIKAQLLPGINSTTESLNDLQIRGGPPDQVSYKWNNIRLLQTSLFYGKVSGVNPFMVDDISITRNGSSADQSGQASGSILLESSEKINNKFKLKFFSDLLYANIGLNIPMILDRLSAKVAYRKSHNYLFDSKIYNDYFDQTFQFGQLINDQFYIDFYGIRGQEEITKRFSFDDLSASINWQPTKKLNFTSSLINIGNQFQYDYFDGLFSTETKSDQLNLSNLGWNVKGKYQLKPNITINAFYNGSQYKNHYLFLRNLGESLPEDRFKENDVNQTQLRVDVNYEHQHFDMTLGIQSEKWDVGYLDTTRLSSIGISNTKTNLSTTEQSAFAKIKWKFIPKTILETGLRYSDFGLSLVDRKFIEPRLHLSHTLTSRLTIHAHYGLFHQNLNRRLFSAPLEVEKGIWYLSDERPSSNNFIWVVQNTQSSLGLKYLIKQWKFTVDAYRKKAENIWTSALDFAVEEDPFAFADLIVNGLELSSHFQNENWRFLWTYELTDETMEVKLKESYKIKSPFTQRHKISFMQSFKQGPWTFSSRWRFNSGRRYSKGSEFITITEPQLYYGIEYESILEEQIAPYHSLDASVQYKWILNSDKKRWVELGLHVQNLYNRDNVIKRQYFIDYTKTPFELAFYDRKGLGFTPNFSLSMYF